MNASKSSAVLRRFKAPIAVALCLLLSGAAMALAADYFYRAGSTLWFGDAEAHLNIARRVFDSRTPGWYQLGTVWLPLPHLAMIPLVRNDWYWKTGLAGAIPAAAAMTLAAAFFFAAMQRLFGSLPAAAGTAVVMLNPNTLYLGSIPMSEPYFFACLFALLYFAVRFLDTAGWGAVVGAAIAAFLGALTRYDGWILIPFVAIWVAVGGRKRGKVRRVLQTVFFCIAAGAGPLLWLAHNRYYYSDPLYFFRGPYSALAIQKGLPYPGKNDWIAAAHYYFEAGRLIAGWPAIVVGAAGIVLAVLRRAVWPAVLLALPCCFYVWSLHSGGTPIFVPTLWPNSYYNTRYAIAFLPLIGLGVAAIGRLNRWAGVAAAGIAFVPLMLQPAAMSAVRKESEINSRTRREWTAAAAKYLAAGMDAHDTFITSFGDMTGIFRTLGIPLRSTLTQDNDVEWAETLARPEVFLNEDWAVVTSGDEMQTILDRLRLNGPRYDLEKRVFVKGGPVIEIYHRNDAIPQPAPAAPDEDDAPQSNPAGSLPKPADTGDDGTGQR